MKASELKSILKPLIKEVARDALKELLFEEGVLSGLIKEVVASMPVMPQNAPSSFKPSFTSKFQQELAQTKAKTAKPDLEKKKSALLERISLPTVDGLNVFSGTEPLRDSKRDILTESIGGKQFNIPGPLNGLEPDDAGVDISQFFKK